MFKKLKKFFNKLKLKRKENRFRKFIRRGIKSFGGIEIE